MTRVALLLLLCCQLSQAGKTITVFVALCDNKTQGIVPVGRKIGNGDDAANNLYWGCSDGTKTHFKRSAHWKLAKSIKPAPGHILETCEFQHQSDQITLTAHAYRGSEMKRCLEDFFAAARAAGKDELVAFIGHNGLMDTTIAPPTPAGEDDEPSSAIVLCCISEKYFSRHLDACNSRPLLLTSQLMYPGSFILHDCIEVWRKRGSRAEHRAAAGRAYARNQKISVKAGTGVFARLEP